MSERGRRGRPPVGRDAGEWEDPADAEGSVLVQPALSEAELLCAQLRGRWELASVLNFMHVFRPIIRSELKVSAEEMEMALVMPDAVLAQLHIALLKGIPPIRKNLIDSDAWITVLCRKLKMWWPWVAEGEVPLVADHGGEILRYKELDPITRLLILKALCEIRVQVIQPAENLMQDDISRYIDEEVKHGGQLSKFRKDSIGGNNKGTTYWYDGDSVIGHRLYKNISKVEFKQKLKARGRLTQPVVNCQWETLATNSKEFQEVSGKLLRSKISSKSAVGNVIKVDIMPVIEELEKKKERALKRKKREALLLDGFKNCDISRSRRSCRDRRPVSYTFDDYDRSINEAIQEAKKMKKAGLKKGADKDGEHVAVGKGFSETESLHQDPSENDMQTSTEELDNDNKYWASDDEDEDYNEKADYRRRDTYGDGDIVILRQRKGDFSRQTRLRSTVNQEGFKGKDIMGLHRMSAASNETVAHDMGQAEAKKRLRERPTRNTGYDLNIITDSEEGRSSDEDQEREMLLGTQKERSIAANELPGKPQVRELFATAG